MTFKIDGILERLGIRKEHSVGIAMSGGGAKGFSHIGVLKAFEQFGIKPDVLSGVSAGSIAVAMYGSGLSTDDMI
ncbi:MAG: patatin-like phospholipase family protein, partial [Muribaculaceae bacterium]|nr:patatin-like phospholipase family protein [Muribaculaceae bacterium]